jgi:hypothetical protein
VKRPDFIDGAKASIQEGAFRFESQPLAVPIQGGLSLVLTYPGIQGRSTLCRPGLDFSGDLHQLGQSRGHQIPAAVVTPWLASAGCLRSLHLENLSVCKYMQPSRQFSKALD